MQVIRALDLAGMVDEAVETLRPGVMSAKLISTLRPEVLASSTSMLRASPCSICPMETLRSLKPMGPLAAGKSSARLLGLS